MLSLACAIAFMPLNAQIAIPVRNGRPSRLVQIMRGGEGPRMLPDTLHVASDDAAGLIRVNGSVEEAEMVRQFVKELDVPRPMIKVKIHIESPSDHTSYDVTTSVRSNQRWKMTDEESGLSIALEPKLNADRTATLTFRIVHPGGSQEQRVRLKNGQNYPVVLGSSNTVNARIVREDEAEGVAESLPNPKLTFQLTLPKDIK